MLEERYNNMMEGVELSPELVQRTLRATRPHRKQTGAWKPMLVIALCVVMVVGAAAWRITQIAHLANHPASQATDPESSIDPADRFTVTPGTPYIIGEGTPDSAFGEAGDLCFPLIITGDGLNSSTYFVIEPPVHPGLIHAGTAFRQNYAPDEEGTAYPSIRMRLADGIAVEDLTGTVTMCLKEISLCSQHEAITHHALDLSTVPLAREETRTVVQYYGRTVQEDGSYGPLHALDPQETQLLVPGEPIVELAGGMAITAIGFEQKSGHLVIQARIPLSLPGGSTCNVLLTPVEDGTGSSDGGWVHWNRERPWYDEANGYRYVEFIFADANRSNYTNYSLRTFTHPIDEIITGPWTLTYDLDAIETPD